MTLVLCTTCSNETESGYPCSWCADKADCLELCKLYAVDPEKIDLTQLIALPEGQRGDFLYRVKIAEDRAEVQAQVDRMFSI